MFRVPFYRNYDSKEEILESVFKRTVHNILWNSHHYTIKKQTFIWFGFTFREARKEARVIYNWLDYHLWKKFVQATWKFLEKYQMGTKKVSSYLHSFSGATIVTVLLKWISRMARRSAEKNADLGVYHFKKNREKRKKRTLKRDRPGMNFLQPKPLIVRIVPLVNVLKWARFW